MKGLDRVVWFLLAAGAALVVVAGNAAASPPADSPAYIVFGPQTQSCNEPNPDLQLSASLYYLGQNPPPGWANKLPPNPPPPGVKLLPQAPLKRDVPNLVGLAIENPCSVGIVLSFYSVNGTALYGIVAPGTDALLTRDDLMVAGLWQFEIVGFGMGGDPSALPVTFSITSKGVEPIGP